ncbi:hypothetical protein L596_027731 [Steinernema carpocapsae]|uniref:histidine--tRNA ligase n=1 Tax=Steinernema carpocapsae TaxID=34508 RepID=A0A4U5LWC5_STECR|nr:hypothetical protein L596_027731 [Steinernema carpocapsae]
MMKVPKGTRDYKPEEEIVRQEVISIAVKHFKANGASPIATPVFEMRSLLQRNDQYGEETKLIYNLEDQGGEELSLRYDQTVPFARFLGMNRLSDFKRYQVATVYRRDQPSAAKGRYREFYQADYDFAGQSRLMLADSECMKIMDDIFRELNIGEFTNKFNHKVLLTGILEVCKVPADKFKTVCSSIDKLDKQPLAEVCAELVKVKNIPEEAVDSLKGFISLRTDNPEMPNGELLEALLAKAEGNENIIKGVEELRRLLKYCEGCHFGSRITFDPSLARGLDYYTGVIYETVITRWPFEAKDGKKKKSSKDDNVGSVAAGGRYDGLVKSISGYDVPCVGFSLGIERIFRLIERRNEALGIPPRRSDVDVFIIASASPDKLEDLEVPQMLLRYELQKVGLNTGYSCKPKLNIVRLFDRCEKDGVPLIVILGEEEYSRKMVKIRDVKARQDEEIALDDVLKKVLERLGR